MSAVSIRRVASALWPPRVIFLAAAWGPERKVSVIMFGCRGRREIGNLMSKQAVSNVSYPVTPGTTVLLSIDCQFGFGAGSWEQVPDADAAVENFRAASRAWRACGGAVAHVQTAYTPERAPSGRITDFEPDACASQAIGTLPAEQAHAAAIQRMAYLFAAVEDTDAFVEKVRALQLTGGSR